MFQSLAEPGNSPLSLFLPGPELQGPFMDWVDALLHPVLT